MMRPAWQRKGGAKLMREVKTIQDQCTQLHVTKKKNASALQPQEAQRWKPASSATLHEPGGGPAKSAVTLPGTRGFSLMIQAGHGIWMCFVGPQSIFKNILISCQHLKTQRFYIKVWISNSS